MIIKYLAGPVIGSVIGYFTNFIAVKMLFHPKKEVRVLGHKLPEQYQKENQDWQNLLGTQLGTI